MKKQQFEDNDYKVFTDSKMVEIDLFNEKPLVVGEVTAITRQIKKVTTTIRKAKFIEELYGEVATKLFVTYAIVPEIKQEVEQLLEKAGFETIVLYQKGLNK